MNRQSQWLFETPFVPPQRSYHNAQSRQDHPIQLEQETPQPAVRNICLQAGRIANRLRAEIQTLKNSPKIKDPRQRQIAIERRAEQGKRWLNGRVREVIVLLDQLSPRELDLLYGCLARVAAAIGSETLPLRRLRGEVEKRLANKGIP